MEIRYKKFRRVLGLALLVWITVIVVNLAPSAENNAGAVYMDSPQNLAAGTFEPLLWLNKSAYVKWWRDDQSGQYYFFVPGAAEGKKLDITFQGTEYVYIDEQKIKSGEKYRFLEGKHVLKTGDSPDSTIYDLEIIYTSSIAALFLETDSGTLDFIHMSKDNSESGKMLILDGRGHKYFEGSMEEIHCRGNSSFEDTEKKSYTIKLSQKADLFGMGAAKKWILTANAFDATLLRNTAAFSIAKLLKLPYTPEIQYVDVYANGSFVGNYLLSEKIEVGKSRVDVRDLEDEVQSLNEELNPDTLEFFMEQQGRLFSTKGYRIEKEPDDLSGGYLLELELSDRYGLEASGFLTSRMQAVVFASPKYASYAQVSYIAERYQDFEDAVFSADGYSPYTGAAYSEYIDMDSFARKYLLEELAKNLDASFTSQYIYKYDDSISDKFFAGPCWDYDKSIAASGITEDGIDLHDPSGLYAASQRKDSDIWYALYQHEDFRERVSEIFFTELEPQLRKQMKDILYQNKELITKSNNCNMIRWNTFSGELAQKQEEYEQRVQELDEFIQKRLDFLEKEWG